MYFQGWLFGTGQSIGVLFTEEEYRSHAHNSSVTSSLLCRGEALNMSTRECVIPKLLLLPIFSSLYWITLLPAIDAKKVGHSLPPYLFMLDHGNSPSPVFPIQPMSSSHALWSIQNHQNLRRWDSEISIFNLFCFKCFTISYMYILYCDHIHLPLPSLTNSHVKSIIFKSIQMNLRCNKG